VVLGIKQKSWGKRKYFFILQIKSFMDLALSEFILPKGILEYFDLVNVVQLDNELELYLEERNIHPDEYQQEKLTSKGFYDEIKVQDFPIRGKDVFLYVKRRRWLNENTGESVFRNWEVVAKGTRMTKEFASFLKVIHRYQTNKL
jgi:hypothetical protein